MKHREHEKLPLHIKSHDNEEFGLDLEESNDLEEYERLEASWSKEENIAPKQVSIKSVSKKHVSEKNTCKKKNLKKNSSERKTSGKKVLEKNTSVRKVSKKRKSIKASWTEHLDLMLASAGALILIFGIATAGFYFNARNSAEQAAAMADIGKELEGIDLIGGRGLLAVADAQSVRLAAMLEEEKSPTEFDEKEFVRDIVDVEVHASSMQKDLKIKFVNQETGKLIPNVVFEVKVEQADGKSLTLTDDNMDGIIYQADMKAGKCKLTIGLPAGTEGYQLPEKQEEVTVKDKIEYKKVNVADEVKTEAEVNAAQEDTKKKETVEESKLKDTVTWVESEKIEAEKTEPGAEGITEGITEGYEEVPKDRIPDPLTFAKSQSYQKLAAVEGQSATSITLNMTQVSLKAGESNQLTAVTVPEGQRVNWTCSDTNVIAVDQGKVTAVNPGTATVFAALDNGKTAICTVNVTADGQTQGISVTMKETSLTLYIGEERRLEASVTGTADVGINWSSAQSEIVAVDGDGNIGAKKAGVTVITATSQADPNKKATCSVTVKGEPTGDQTGKLKDIDGNQLYIKQGDGSYKEAVYADYYTDVKFYKKTAVQGNGTEGGNREGGGTSNGSDNGTGEGTKYTGWQTMDGKTYFFDQNGNKVTGEQVIQGAKYQFGSDGALSASSGNLGIDVSKWNGSIDWNAVKNSGVSYVIIRCGYRGSTTGALIEDPAFRTNIQGATAAGLKVGIYFFTQAVNESEAVEEASMVLQLISSYKISYPVFLDVEASGGRADSISRETRTAVCNAFCQTIQNSGYTAGIYANKTWFSTHINVNSLTQYKIWLAQYAAEPTYTASKYDLWQYTERGGVAGIKGNVDLNISYLGY